MRMLDVAIASDESDAERGIDKVQGNEELLDNL